MSIDSPEALAEAVQEFQRLRDAAPESPDAARREELDAEIKAYYAQNAAELEKGGSPRY